MGYWAKRNISAPSLACVAGAKYRERERDTRGWYFHPSIPPSRSSLFFSRHIDFSPRLPRRLRRALLALLADFSLCYTPSGPLGNQLPGSGCTCMYMCFKMYDYFKGTVALQKGTYAYLRLESFATMKQMK